MENLIIEKTSRTPFVNLSTEGLIEIKGNSLIENTEQFYSSIQLWIEKYIKNPQEKTIVNFSMRYYNTSSQMWIFQIINSLTNLNIVGQDVVFNWYYNDVDIKESGEDIASLLNIEINTIELSGIKN